MTLMEWRRLKVCATMIAAAVAAVALGGAAQAQTTVSAWGDWAAVEVGDTRAWVTGETEVAFERVLARSARGWRIATWRGCPRETNAALLMDTEPPIRVEGIDAEGRLVRVDTRLPTGHGYQARYVYQSCAPGGACLVSIVSRVTEPSGGVEITRGLMRVEETRRDGGIERTSTMLSGAPLADTVQTTFFAPNGAVARIEMRIEPRARDGADAAAPVIGPIVMRPFDPAADAALCAGGEERREEQ